jgi:hypothetical protein
MSFVKPKMNPEGVGCEAFTAGSGWGPVASSSGHDIYKVLSSLEVL